MFDMARTSLVKSQPNLIQSGAQTGCHVLKLGFPRAKRRRATDVRVKLEERPNVNAVGADEDATSNLKPWVKQKRELYKAAITVDEKVELTGVSSTTEVSLPPEARVVEYSVLKEELLRLTVQIGLALTAYVGIGVGISGATSALVGAAGGAAYMILLSRWVDELRLDDREILESWPGGSAAKFVRNGGAWPGSWVANVYGQALMKPQMLAPASLVVGSWLYNVYVAPLFGLEAASLLYMMIGFSSYKLAVLAWVYRTDVEPLIAFKAKSIELFKNQ